MAFITAQNTLSTFLTFWHLFHVQGVKFPSQVSRRKIYDVNYEFDPLDVKKVSESQKCAQSVLNRNERHTFWRSLPI